MNHCRWNVLKLILFWIPPLFTLLGLSSENRVVFEDVTEKTGITWVHENGMSPERYLPETMNGGCAFLDYDNDGWIDIYFVNSGTSAFYKPKKPLRNALYRNNHNGTFTDVTEKAGVGGRGFGMGAAVGDYNNDGWTDLFVTGVETSILYRNNGDGTFREVTADSRISTPGWSTSAAWFDYNNDGNLDLFVCGFVTWRPELNIYCGNVGLRGYCIPEVFEGGQSWLFRNNGDSSFTDVSNEAGIANPEGKGLGVVAADINDDGWMDIFEANDTVPNYLYKNNGDGTFQDIGLFADVAFSREGKARSGMGVDAQDYDDDGRVDLFVANIDHEFFSVYRNLDGEIFEDAALMTPQITRATRFMSGWGARFFDYDNDGDHDLVVLNGHPDDLVARYQSAVAYREKPLMFENVEGVYRDVGDVSGSPFQKLYSGRGLGLADYDNDGDYDLLFCNNGEPPALLRNEGGNRNHWLGLKLVGRKSNRNGIGAKISYSVSGKRRLHYVSGGGSYLSSHEHRVILGFGKQEKTGEIRILWPSGTVAVLKDVEMGRYIEVVEGS
ncbi:MAG: CRTAC1 family protein [Acidobacteriota bacterium]